METCFTPGVGDRGGDGMGWGWGWDGMSCPLHRSGEEDQPPADPGPVSDPGPFPGIPSPGAGLESCSLSPILLPDPLPTLRNLGERHSTLSHSTSGGEFELFPLPTIPRVRAGIWDTLHVGFGRAGHPQLFSRGFGCIPASWRSTRPSGGVGRPPTPTELPDPIPASRFSLDSEIYAEILDESSRPRSGSRCFPWEFSVRGVLTPPAHPKFPSHPHRTSQKVLEDLG